MRESKVKDKVYAHQAIFLITTYRMMVPLTYAPLVKSQYANQDTWIIVLLSIPYTIIFSFPLLYLSNKFYGMNLLEFTEIIMGKIIGRILAVVYGIIFLFYLAFFTGTFIEILESAMYPNTPYWVNVLLLIVTTIYIVNKGLINIGRLSEFVFPIVLFVFFLLLLVGFENYDFDVLLPILKDSTFKSLNLGAMFASLVQGDILILTMLSHHLEKKKDLNKVFTYSVLYSTIIVLLSTIAIQATLGVTYTKHVNFPFYNFARLIRIGDTMGFDLLYVVSWIIGSILRLCGYFYNCSIAFGKIFNTRNQKTYIPIAIIVSAIVIYIESRRTLVTKVGIPQALILTVTSFSVVVIPSILLITYFFRRKSLSKSRDFNRYQ